MPYWAKTGPETKPILCKYDILDQSWARTKPMLCSIGLVMAQFWHIMAYLPKDTLPQGFW